MNIPSEKQALDRIARRICNLLEVNKHDRVLSEFSNNSGRETTLEIGNHRFVIQWKGTARSAAILLAIESLRKKIGDRHGSAIPIVAVPYMGEAGSKRLEEAKMSWLDLCGNARIVAPGLRIEVTGKPNLFKRKGRPSSAFAPRSSRISRWLLLHPTKSFTQRKLAEATGIDEGFTSRIVRKLEDDRLLVREENGAVKPRDPATLLDSWHEAYDFSKHQIIEGHIAARSSDELLKQVVKYFKKESIRYAATGLAGAWLLNKFAGFRLVSVYLAEEPTDLLLDSIGFREESRGSNIWLIVPKDEGVFHGASAKDGIHCVHPVQVYLDLKAHPERSTEAARSLRAKYLNWKADGN